MTVTLVIGKNIIHTRTYTTGHREVRKKTILNVSTDRSLLTYNQTRLFHFSQETSGEGLTETDTICTVNLPLIVRTKQPRIQAHIFLIQSLMVEILGGGGGETKKKKKKKK